MTSQDIALRRLFSQQIGTGHFSDPAALIRWMGCIRADDFPGAIWSISQRVQSCSRQTIENAFNEGRILRTYLLAPAWQLVAVEDIGWLLALTAPRIKAFNNSLYRALGMDAALLRKGRGIITRGLRDGQLTQPQLQNLLHQSHLPLDEIRMNLLIMDASLEGIICTGSLVGRHFTYTLLDRRAPIGHRYDKLTAIGHLTLRYFRSRGPATQQDFLQWSGLRPSEAQTGIQINRHHLQSETFLGETYWFDPTPVPHKHSLHLLPAYDELQTSYVNNGIFKPTVIIDGEHAGAWSKDTIDIPGRKEPWITAATQKARQAYHQFHNNL